MKNFVLALAFLVVCGSGLVWSQVATKTAAKDTSVIVTVTSTDPKEILTFTSSYLFGDKGSKLISSEQKTPFEIKGDAELITGVFQKLSGNANLLVSVKTLENKTETNFMTGSSNNVVIVTTQPDLSAKLNNGARLFLVRAYDK